MEKGEEELGLILEGRSFFAEFAEVVGISTSDVFAVHQDPDNGVTLVLYTKNIESLPREEYPNAIVYGQGLKRGRDGLLEKVGPETAVGSLADALQSFGA